VDRIAGLISERVTDKDQPLLLHCHAGVRSASAKKILEQLGYTNLVDLGSYGQAEAILRAARG
jgi:phage shock protein E